METYIEVALSNRSCHMQSSITNAVPLLGRTRKTRFDNCTHFKPASSTQCSLQRGFSTRRFLTMVYLLGVLSSSIDWRIQSSRPTLLYLRYIQLVPVQQEERRMVGSVARLPYFTTYKFLRGPNLAGHIDCLADFFVFLPPTSSVIRLVHFHFINLVP